jgi:hypothetical protein
MQWAHTADNNFKDYKIMARKRAHFCVTDYQYVRYQIFLMTSYEDDELQNENKVSIYNGNNTLKN